MKLFEPYGFKFTKKCFVKNEILQNGLPICW